MPDQKDLSADRQDLPKPQEDLPKLELDLPLPEKGLPLPEKELTANSKGSTSNSPLQGVALQETKVSESDEVEPEKHHRLSRILLSFLFGFLFVVLIVIIGGGAIFLGNKSSKPENKQIVETKVQSPSPTPDPTADWETYNNSKYKYLIKYPEYWEPSRGPGNSTDEELKSVDQFDLYDPNLPNGDPGTGFNIIVNDSTNCTDLNDCYSKSFKWLNVSQTVNSTDTTFLEVPAKTFSYTLKNQLYSQAWKYIFFIYGNNTYNLHIGTNIERQEKDFKIFDQILSTFKFTDQSSTSSQSTNYCPDSKGMSYEDALAIAENSVCATQGTLQTTKQCNPNGTGYWWLDFTPTTPKSGCNPACVVDVAAKTAEINWRCTGLLN